MSDAHKRILDALSHSAAGMTDSDLELVLKIPANTLRPRRRELVRAGKVRDSGLNRNGFIVWEIDPVGEPHPATDGRRHHFNRLKRAAEPFAANAKSAAEHFGEMPDSAVMLVTARMSMGALREFVAAMEA